MKLKIDSPPEFETKEDELHWKMNLDADGNFMCDKYPMGTPDVMAEVERITAAELQAEADRLEASGDAAEAARLRGEADQALERAEQYEQEAAALIAEINGNPGRNR